MKLQPDKRHPLRNPLMLSSFLITIGAAMLTISYQRRMDARDACTTMESRLVQLERRRQQTQETIQLTQEMLTQWNRHLQAGLSQPLNRLAWIDSIQQLPLTRGITLTDYEFGPDLVTGKKEENAPKPLISLTPLHIQTAVAHEEHFIELLAVIRKTGRNTMQECSLFIPENDSASPHTSSLRAECRLLLHALSSANNNHINE